MNIEKLLMLASALVSAIALAACGGATPYSGVNGRELPARQLFSGGDDERIPQEVEAARRGPYGSLLGYHRQGRRSALRIQVDGARNRLWVLGADHVYVYDIGKKRLIRRVALANWSVARFVCPPGMTLDGAGAAVISSNVSPRIWRIDPDSFAVGEHEIRLLAREGWETGFGGLAVAPDGTLFALTSLAGSLWRIDVGEARGSEIALPARLLETCSLSTPYRSNESEQGAPLALCAAGRNGARRIEISPDRSQGQVTGESCG